MRYVHRVEKNEHRCLNNDKSYCISFLLSLPISKNYNDRKNTVWEHHLQTTWTWLNYNCPVNQSASPCPCRITSIQCTSLSQLTDKCCTITPKYSNCQIVLATPIEDGWDIYWYPTNLCYVSCFTFSFSVMCHCSSRSSPDCFITNLIKQTAWTCQYNVLRLDAIYCIGQQIDTALGYGY